MNESLYEPDEATLASDDELLDELGRGIKVPGNDTIALAMFMWRDDLVTPARAAVAARARRRRLSWGIVAAAAAAMLGAGATVAAASTAEPGSPLWPITEQVFPERASSTSAAAARTKLAEARQAATEQSYPRAQRLLAEADVLIAKVQSLPEREVLRAEADQVRALLTALPAPSVTPAPSATASPGAAQTSAPTPTPSPSKQPGLLPLPTLLPSLLP